MPIHGTPQQKPHRNDPPRTHLGDGLRGKPLSQLAHTVDISRQGARSRRRKEIAERLQKASAELRALEEMIRSEDVDAEVLGEFREALGHARHSAWAVQQWMELHAKHDDPFPVISYLSAERVRLVTGMCKHLAKDI